MRSNRNGGLYRARQQIVRVFPVLPAVGRERGISARIQNPGIKCEDANKNHEFIVLIPLRDSDGFRASGRLTNSLKGRLSRFGKWGRMEVGRIGPRLWRYMLGQRTPRVRGNPFIARGTFAGARSLPLRHHPSVKCIPLRLRRSIAALAAACGHAGNAIKGTA